MIIIGHKAIKYPSFKYIKNINEISKTKANNIIIFDIKYDINYSISIHCNKYNINYAIKALTTTDAILYANLGAKYIIYNDFNTAKLAQKIADTYFFDSKILCIINNDNDLEKIADLGIDGVIFKNIIDNF